MPSTYVRCKKCSARRTVKKALAEYVRALPKCHACGNDEQPVWRQVKKYRSETCRCDGYSFPHRLGSGCCFSNPNWQQNQEAYYSTMEI